MNCTLHNLQALDFEIPNELMLRLNEASKLELKFPYSFFGSEIQAMIHGGVTVGDKPQNYYPLIETSGSGAGVESSTEQQE